MEWNYGNFMLAVKEIIKRKAEIVVAAEQVAQVAMAWYNLAVSIIAAYESARFGTYSRAVPNEDAADILSLYEGKQGE